MILGRQDAFDSLKQSGGLLKTMGADPSNHRCFFVKESIQSHIAANFYGREIKKDNTFRI